MQIFEHLSMVVFLILGLGLGLVKLMTSFGSVVSRKLTTNAADESGVRYYLAHSLLLTMVFIGMVVFWWNAYPLNRPELMAEDDWNLFYYLLFLCSPVTYFLMSDVLMPRDSHKASIDLKKHYYDNYKVLIGLSLALQFFSTTNLLVFFKVEPLTSQVIGRVVLFVFLTPLYFSKKERLHEATMCLFFIGFIYSMLKYHIHV